MADNIAIILARGGSKGIPRKNIVDLCGKPLLAWSVLQASAARNVDSTWVSSDDAEILEVARSYGADVIERPADLANDEATSESGWLHAVDIIEGRGVDIELVIGLQATSPLRDGNDIDNAIKNYQDLGCDSLFSATLLDDYLVWEPDDYTGFTSVNYDHGNRGRRQDREAQYLENGSIYIFGPRLLRKTRNRLAGIIGVSLMPRWRSFEIDMPEDLVLCEALMKNYLLGGA